MARYFFDLHNGDHFTPDAEGQEMDDWRDAEHEAIALLPDIARQVIPDGDARTIVSSLRNEDGKVLLRATLTLKVERDSGV